MALRPPLKVLATEGFRTQTPPSFLLTVSAPLPALSSLVSVDVIMLKSVFTPRSSRVLIWAAAFGVFELAVLLIRFVTTNAPEPLDSIRRVPLEPVR